MATPYTNLGKHTYMYALRNTAYVKIYVCACVHRYICRYMYVLHHLGSGLQIVDTQRVGPQTLLANECGRRQSDRTIHYSLEVRRKRGWGGGWEALISLA